MTLTLTDRGFQSTTAGTSATNTVTSGSFSPTGGYRVLVFAHCTMNNTTPTFSLSDTFTGTGAWSEPAAGTYDYGNGYKVRVSVYTAVLGGSPGTGTITVTRAAGTNDQWLTAYFREVTGNPCTIGNSGGLGTAGTTTTVTFAPSAPASSSLCVGSASSDNNSAAITPPSGWTEITENFDAAWFGDHELASIASSAGSTAQWGGGNSNVCASAVELIETTGGTVPLHILQPGVPYTPNFKGWL